MNSTTSIIVATSAAAAIGVYILLKPSKSKGQDKTSQPLKLPLIGDLHSSPIEQPLKNWDAWAKAQGAVATTKLFGIVPIVIINTNEAVTELLSRRSAWYSNRPSSVSVEMSTDSGPGQSKFTLMHDVDDHLKLHHRLLAPSLGHIASVNYQPMMELEVKQLLTDLLDLHRTSPVVSTTDAYPLLERTQASIILALHYGYRVLDTSDPLYHEVGHVLSKVNEVASIPRLPDFLPFLRHLPAVLSPWKRRADAFFEEQSKLYLKLLKIGDESSGWNATKQARAAAEKHAPDGVPEIDLAFTLATSISGGIETSPRALLWLFAAAAAANQDFMARAHAILDEVVGQTRIPSFADRPKLAYIDAIFNELMRWRPISPGGIPRRADKTDVYNGKPIVKNATIVANAWSIGRDSAAYDPVLGDLEDFVPERWLDGHDLDHDVTQQGQLRSSLPSPVFGQGKRMCMGKRVAQDGGFMQLAAMIWAFDIELVGSVDVMDMTVVGFMTEPAPFNFRLKPRGDWVARVVESEYRAASQ